MRRLAALIVLLTACSSDPSAPSTTSNGDGPDDGASEGDGDAEGDADPTTSSTGEPLLDVPTEGIPACCFCADGGWCETHTYPTMEACQSYAEEWGVEWEWHANCYPDNTQAGGVTCPGSCINP